jgi:hypothetical protein
MLGCAFTGRLLPDFQRLLPDFDPDSGIAKTNLTASISINPSALQTEVSATHRLRSPDVGR